MWISLTKFYVVVAEVEVIVLVEAVVTCSKLSLARLNLDPGPNLKGRMSLNKSRQKMK